VNLTDTLPELIRSAREIIKSTAGIRQFEETCSPLQAGYPLDGQIIAAIAAGSRTLEAALLRVEQTLATVDAERRQLEAAFAALTSDDPEEQPPRPAVHRVAEEAPVVAAATPPVPVFVPKAAPPVPPVAAPEVSSVPNTSHPASVEIPPAPSIIATAEDKPGSEKKSSKKIKRCKKCHKRKKCTCAKKA
jgi:hypothetical protein